MNRRLKTMQLIAELADGKAEAALHKLAGEQDSLARGEAQLAELERFAREYREGVTGTGLTMAELLNRQRFLQRINEAIAYQQRAVARLRESLDSQRRVWADAKGKAKALDAVVERLDQADARAGERHEQTEADDRARRPRSPWD